jgi:hypothetical protein
MTHAAYDRELEHIAEVCDGVERISETLSRPDAATIDAALALLGAHRQTTEDLKVLCEKLMEIETQHESDATAFPDQRGKNDLAACITALDAVLEFLDLRAYSLNLGILRRSLLDIVLGASPAAMFQPEQCGRGRPPDSPLVLQAMYFGRHDGGATKSRDVAAASGRMDREKRLAKISGTNFRQTAHPAHGRGMAR